MGNDVWRYLIQSACRRQGQAEQAAQDIIHLGFEYFQCQTLHSLSGQPVSIADCFHKKKLFLMFKCNFLYFNLCPLPRLLSTGTTGCILSALRSRYYLSTFLPQLSCNCLVTFLNNDFTSTGMFYAWQMKIFRNRVLRLSQLAKSLETTPHWTAFCQRPLRNISAFIAVESSIHICQGASVHAAQST